MDVTNPGLPPALSKVHHEEVAERVQSLKAELERFLDALDEVLEGPNAASRPSTPSAA